MQANELLVDAFNRIKDIVAKTVDGLSADDLAFRPNDSANSIAWLVWHLTRIQDDHISSMMGREQLWYNGWYERFDLPFNKAATGYAHSSEEVALVRSDSKLLLGYHEAVNKQTLNEIAKLNEQDYRKL